MSKILARLKMAVTDISLRAYVALQLFAAQEPVRLRSSILAAVLAAGLYLGADVSGVAEPISYVGAVALPIIVGESARKRVTPIN